MQVARSAGVTRLSRATPACLGLLLVAAVTIGASGCAPSALSSSAPVAVAAEPEPWVRPEKVASRPAVARPIVHVCTAHHPAENPWRREIRDALDRLFSTGYSELAEPYEVQMDASPDCLKLSMGSCAGEYGHVYCDEDTLSRSLEVMTWRSAAWAVEYIDNYNLKQRTEVPFYFPISTLATVELVDASRRGNTNRLTTAFAKLAASTSFDADEWREIIAAQLSIRDNGSNTFFTDTTVQGNTLVHGKGSDIAHLAYMLYESAANILLAYVLGHELSHAYSHCAFSEPARVEQDGLTAEMSALQASGLVCRTPVFADEELADVCGLRGARRMVDRILAWKTAHYDESSRPPLIFATELVSLSRRLAIDMSSWLLMMGLAEPFDRAVHIDEVGPGGETLVTLNVRRTQVGYLHGVLRFVLFAEELRRGEDWAKAVVRICDGSAEQLAIALRHQIASCFNISSREQQLEAEARLVGPLGAFVPSRLKAGWEEGSWDTRSVPNIFSCE